MSAFKFRLDPVVSLKKQAEDMRKTDLAKARRDLGRKETHLVNLLEHRSACQNNVVSIPECSNLNVAGKLVYYAYMERLTDEIADQAVAVEESRGNVNSKREMLLESSREKKALENLRHRMKERFTRNVRKAEQASLDDTAGKLHSRNGDRNLQWKKE